MAVALVLVSLGLLADTLPYQGEGRGIVGSVSIIPYSAAILLVPGVEIVGAVAIAQIIVGIVLRRGAIKGLFNVAQYVLLTSVAIIVLRLSAAHSERILELGFADVAISVLPRSVPAFAALVLANKVAVTAVVSAATGQPFAKMFVDALRNALPILLLQMLFAAYLAWLAAHMGVLGAAWMALPILALRQLSRTTIELTKVTEELLDLMVAAIEARDPYTSGHSKRVAATAVRIARAIGLRESEVERVQVAALLHDVGKIHEEFARILAKEGRLTPEEWDIMKRHPVRSAELVGLVTTLRDVVPGVRHHHENWDGTGYPDGRRGEEIPLASRIIMFADTLDAITTDRPYRKALDPEEAKREFIKFKGKQFDPRICDTVVSDQVWDSLYRSVRRSRAGESTRASRGVGAA
jgi:putative nucleotidyltransferase with HDIG domain